MRSDLPSGTVTFLFTDIEGSTKLLHQLGADRYARSLTDHRRILRAAFAAHGGVEVDTQGDAFFVAFGDAREALAAAREGRDALAEQSIRVRMGVHTGEPLLIDEGYVGIDVHKAARIGAAGHGGQILVSEQTHVAVGGGDLRPLGLHRLKDLTAPEALYQVGADEFPPLKSLNQSNLPVQPTPFVGRERELSEILTLLRGGGRRLLTLTGAGGSGKTRLAVQAAAETVDEREHGVWWVGLQAVRDPDLVVPAIAATIGAREDAASQIANRNMLLLLDNFEQVMGASPALGELLTGCPNLTLLVTSREILHLSGEQEYAVPPLVDREAVDFFVTRARSARADFAGNEAVTEICRRLDHLPLALELAAARVKALSPAQILERLEQRLPLLTGGPRDAPERQRTLRTTIQWSYELLSPDEQTLFQNLAVFGGRWTADAAEHVAGADIDTLQSLVDKSLLRFDGERFTMLETIREFATELLESSGRAGEVSLRHAEFFLSVAELASLSAEAEYGRRHDLAIAEQDNLRAAIDWAVSSGAFELGFKIAIALENFWVTADPFEGMRRFETLLEAESDVSPILRARALRCYGGSSNMAGKNDQAQVAYEESLELVQAAGDDRDVAVLLHRLGTNALNLGTLDVAHRLLEESLVMFRRIGSQRGIAQSLGSLGYLAHAEGDDDSATELWEESLAMVRDSGFVWWQAGMLAALAESALIAGRLDEAEIHAHEQLSLAEEVADKQNAIYGLAFIAWVAAGKRDFLRAGRLWGAIEAQEARGPIGAWESERQMYESHILVSEGSELQQGLEEGRRLSLDQAIDEALRQNGDR